MALLFNTGELEWRNLEWAVLSLGLLAPNQRLLVVPRPRSQPHAPLIAGLCSKVVRYTGNSEPFGTQAQFSNLTLMFPFAS